MAPPDAQPQAADHVTQERDVTPEADDKEEEDVAPPVAPDGGWAWVVLAASFLSSVIVDGVCFSFGIFYIEFLDYFGENKSKTSWVGSVLNGTYMVMAPLAGALTNKFGSRPVAMLGALWASVAFFVSTFASSVDNLILTYGVLGGIGFGLMYLPSIVTVGYYFDKKRAFATGVATSGSGIGGFLFAPFVKMLVDTLGWKGALWVQAGVVLHGVILGALYRPLDEKYRIQIEKNSRMNNAAKNLDTPDTPESDRSPEEGSNVDPLMRTQEKEDASQNELRSRKPATGSGDTRNELRDSWHSLNVYAASMENMSHVSKQGNKITRRVCGYNDSNRGGCAEGIKEIIQGIKSTMDITMLKDPVFVVYCLSCILCMTGFFVPFIYLPVYVKSIGLTKQDGAFLLSVLGVSNTVGRIVAGWVSDRPWADCLIINNFALLLGGVATAFCPHLTSYVLLAVACIAFGLAIAAFVTLRSIILVDLIGLDKLTSAFGILVLCQGITSFVGAPFAGFLSDVTGTYNVSFYVAGATIALAGLICFPLRRLAAWQRVRLHKMAVDVTELEM